MSFANFLLAVFKKPGDTPSSPSCPTPGRHFSPIRWQQATCVFPPVARMRCPCLASRWLLELQASASLPEHRCHHWQNQTYNSKHTPLPSTPPLPRQVNSPFQGRPSWIRMSGGLDWICCLKIVVRNPPTPNHSNWNWKMSTPENYIKGSAPCLNQTSYQLPTRIFTTLVPSLVCTLTA